MHTMTEHASNLSQLSEGESSGFRTITSRFGEVTLDTRKVINFSRGLLGMPQFSQFVLAEFPSEKMAQFKLLQCLDNTELSFITLPVEIENPIITKDDIFQACQALSISVNDLALLFVVSVYRSPGQVRITVNARAPLFIDAEKMWGVQHVFPHSRYKVQHVIKE